MKRTKKIEQQVKTFDNCVDLLNKYKKCVVIRPTGFGKTYIMVQLASQYRRVLYVYPREILRVSLTEDYAKDLKTIKETMTYTMLGKMMERGDLQLYLAEHGFDLIMFDEVHCAGARKVKPAMAYIRSLADRGLVAMFGATATPDRMDSFDVVHNFFGDRVCFEYTMHDCIQDGMMKKFYYVYSVYDFANAVHQKYAEAIKYMANSKLKVSLNEQLSALELEMANKLNAPEVIRNAVHAVLGNPEYLKFIVFFSQKDSLFRKQTDVIDWYSAAFPNMKVRTLTIISMSGYVDNVYKLKDRRHEKGVIDLIFCVDMLNYGYHIDDISGIMMLRGTHSTTIYSQQVGRCVSIMNKFPPIILDFVDNLHREYYFNVQSPIKPQVTDTSKKKTNRVAQIDERDLVMNDLTKQFDEVVRTKIDRCVDDDILNQVYEMRMNCNFSAKMIRDRIAGKLPLHVIVGHLTKLGIDWKEDHKAEPLVEAGQ